MLPTTVREIKERAGLINMSLKRLARDAELDPSIYYRAAGGKGENLPRSVRPLAEHLVQVERALLVHLLTIHPDVAGSTQAERPAPAGEAGHG